MKSCPVCHAQLNEDCAFCTQCGAPQAAAEAPKSAPEAPAAAAPQPQNTYTNPNATYYPPAQPYVDPYDHTKEFDPKDISENKVIAMCIYLLGWIGILIALLASKESKYVSFHVRQALKIEVTQVILIVALIIPILGWLAYGVCTIILLVLRIIAFFQICGGKAKEIAIIRSFGFMK